MEELIYHNPAGIPQEFTSDTPILTLGPTIASLQQQLTKDSMAHLRPVGQHTTHAEVLGSLLQQIGLVDFRKIVGLVNDHEKIKRNHHVVAVSEEVLALAQRNGWGLCRNNGLLYVYNSAFWQVQSDEDVKHFLQRAAERMGIDKYEARFVTFGRLLLEQFMSTAHLTAPERTNDVTKINLTNGTFHISPHEQALRPFDAADFLTYQLPFAKNEQATATRFQRFLDRVQPDADCQRLLAEYIGYLFVSPAKLKLEKTLILYGPGGNGKSVFFDIVTALLGPENVSHHSLRNLTIDPAYARIKLAKVLVNYASELGGKMDVDVFKQLVSGEPVEVRLPYGNPTIMRDYGKLMFNCNELPGGVEYTDAFYRRFLIVSFPHTIPEAERDPQLANTIIRDELAGVFNWVLDGLRRLLNQGKFTDCAAARQQVEDYKSQSDTVRCFLMDNHYVSNPDQVMLRKYLYADYRIYCAEEGNQPVSSRHFGRRLDHCGIHGTRQSKGHVHFVSRSPQAFL